ncbi:DUF2238 domain-containing protein [Shewanella sedimentimangrovi]|uniref:DUF2238 domain-containing protein n=1 Tax=Shewanella sedimentimangrovi TaxID=2814293 RepID=A0ABX7R523_9GAMM|nr:DUF2238 domain-containing protein [Shewanella sedimentimangrovi]QSX37881.1 DUF2238 domain-containing protein [Shewanella sedimentimangrovi]
MYKPLIWLGSYLAILLWSVYQPHDGFTWFLEAVPALVALPLLALTRKRFPLTPLAYVLVLLHCSILFVGAHYTYAEVPLFDSLAQWMGSERNNYDKLGHLAQGFVPVILAREIMLRKQAVKPGAWCHFLCLCFVLALSAFYELIEWWVAVATGDSAEAFLGTQGYVWDTQSDMLMALLGGMLALLLFNRMHDRQLQKIT